MPNHQNDSSLAVPPRQLTCTSEDSLVEFDLCSQARDLLIVLGVHVCEDGICSLKILINHLTVEDVSLTGVWRK